MRYIIIGAGAIGSTVAAQLELAGIPVVLIARGEHGATIRERGLRYHRPSGERQVRLTVAAGAHEVELTADDVLVLATKTQDTEAVLREWSWRPAGDGAAADLPIVSLQNGLENERAALRRFRTVFGAAIWQPSSYLRPGEVSAEGARQPGIFWLGQFPHGDDPRLSRIADDFRAADFAVQVVPNLSHWKAGKLLGNLRNAVDALYGPNPKIAAELRAEALRVFKAAGMTAADLRAESEVDVSVADVAEVPSHARGGSSTWQSLARGTGSVEADFLNGEIVLLGRLHGVPAPLNEALQHRIGLAAERREEPGSANIGELPRVVPPVLVTAEELARQLESADPPVLLDVRWALGDPNGHRHYLDGHIPGAVYVDLDTELAAPPVPAEGRHPLPDPQALQAAARRWGIREGSRVVAYDNNGNLAAARAWWLLRWAGVEDVRLLDGGLAAWDELETGFGPAPKAGDFVVKSGNMPVLTMDEAGAFQGVLLDARAGERYRGEQEPVDPRAGHIPGAVSAPTAENLAPDGRFRAAEELAARFRELGAGTQVGVYCGSGVTAAHEIAALAVAGIEAALYPGSWSQWSNHPDRPVATGE
ncbi:rhodanese-like domain-containing protein [Amycolatopsis sp. GM8]|uniref:rhodanese-like domain-containing protein n=1 Tax=Amycolatopsis sp. GM8 TaxID=2896530 RepID=UPI0027DF40CA|nr:rhodanese-like domain-containing protein [Amycolatopsis sp. GM8]